MSKTDVRLTYYWKQRSDKQKRKSRLGVLGRERKRLAAAAECGNTLRPVVLKPGDSFSCECGKVHPLGVYVAAHWTEELTHTCDCGRKHTVCNGVVELIENIRKDG